jgi:hypothetical protein
MGSPCLVSDQVFQQWPRCRRPAHQLGNPPFQQVDQRYAGDHAACCHRTTHTQYGQWGSRQMVDNPFGHRRIDVVVKDPVEAHENQCVLPHPDHQLPGRHGPGDKKHHQAAGQGQIRPGQIDKARGTSGQKDGLGQAASRASANWTRPITEIQTLGQPAGPERNDRGRPGRSGGQGLCRCGQRDQGTGQADRDGSSGNQGDMIAATYRAAPTGQSKVATTSPT